MYKKTLKKFIKHFVQTLITIRKVKIKTVTKYYIALCGKLVYIKMKILEVIFVHTFFPQIFHGHFQ